MRTTPLTWWQEFKKGFPISPLGLFQEKKKARSTKESHFRCENTRATIEAGQMLLALQQLASNSNFAIFENNIKRIAKLPKSLTTTLPNFDWRSNLWIVWGSVPNKSENSQPTHGRRQNILFPLPHGWWCFTDIQKHHQSQQREFSINPDCVPREIRKTPVKGYSKTQIFIY